ncbi:MAG: FAD-binding oxidoreductase [Deltaproteobacteria bacterium]|nr:FAD-binding oxidoreductase [Deltaproteobacteria bacterium]MBW2053683.1 FAD-binding oxidoreductase [Deltaproteobacteria bacterium]MBW2142060.1 FAD-binding oxidoreductase [Deltaproteobacteria bacterium]MBW2323981.1 FAD-binding oxidoreductase [Deltaproteobacteria bacterium]
MEKIYRQVEEIVGTEYVSNHPEELFIYSRDMGTMLPSRPDLVAMPGSTEEVQKVVQLANKEEIPIVPMGGGLVLSGLTRPLKGGIVLDLKRMSRILEVNEVSRFAVVEAGASQGMLQAYLKRNHPGLKHSIPDAPPIATLGGNVLIHGSGHLSLAGGFHSEMCNGLEVVLPTGELVKVGSCSTSPYWFSRAPLPDLAGLFMGWAGTTGVVTKLAVKLYPNLPFNDARAFITEDPELVPDVINRMAGAQVGEDMTVAINYRPGRTQVFPLVLINYGGQTKEELTWKRNLIRESVRKYIDERTGGFLPVPPDNRAGMLLAPNASLTQFADTKKGGGFEYVGSIMPLELFAEAYRAGVAISNRYDTVNGMGARVIGLGHCMMFFFGYPFNRADESDVERAREALEASNEAVLKLGGIPWKAEAPAQKQILQYMDPNTYELMNRVRAALDPKGIMNPGNWEVN